MSTETKLSAIKAINEEKNRVQQYIESLAKHKELHHHSITIHGELESQTFIVPPAIVLLIMDDLEKEFQRRNIELIEKAEQLMS